MFNISPSGGLTGTQNTSAHTLSKREIVEITMNVQPISLQSCIDPYSIRPIKYCSFLSHSIKRYFYNTMLIYHITAVR